MAERSSIKATLFLFLVLSALHYSAEEEEARVRCSYKMKKSFEIGNCSRRTVFSRKGFNPLVFATCGGFCGRRTILGGFCVPV
ncbi:hypothetical protein SUGI_0796050 [Cryptomeria japonica]|nr:hypothetical protein SUGI_0796050 [Cryptomeria japonica]